MVVLQLTTDTLPCRQVSAGTGHFNHTGSSKTVASQLVVKFQMNRVKFCIVL
jgi:hypothetical protein